MNRIDERFAKVKADGRKALITFLTVGDPNIEVSEKAIYTRALTLLNWGYLFLILRRTAL